MIKIEGLRNLEFNVRKFNQLDENGFMTIEGVASIADKPMEYIDFWTGKITREVIPLEELEKSQNSIVGVPVTNGHPWDFVNNKNATEYVKGSVIENLGIEDKKLNIKAKIYDGELILAIQGGKDKISIGYICDVEEQVGFVDSGESYTHIQRNIRYNHVGIVNDPRAGEEAKITKFNSKDHDLAYSSGLKEQFKRFNNKGCDDMSIYKINEKEFNEQQLYIEALRLNSENQILKEEKSKLEGQLAVEKENSKKAVEKLNGLEEEIEKRVNSRIELITSIKTNGIDIEGIEKMNELDIKKAVIKKNSTIDIEGKDNNFIDGVYLALMKNNSKDPVQTKTNEKDIQKLNSLGDAWDKLRGGN